MGFGTDWTGKSQRNGNNLPERRRENIPADKTKGENVFMRFARADMPTIMAARELVVQNGLPAPTNRMSLAMSLMKLAKKNGDSLIPDLVAIHPDRKMFEIYYTQMHDGKIGEITSTLKEQFEKENKKNSEDNIKLLSDKMEAMSQLMKSSADKSDKRFENSEGKEKGGCGCSGEDGTQSGTKAAPVDHTQALIVMGTVMTVALIGYFTMRTAK